MAKRKQPARRRRRRRRGARIFWTLFTFLIVAGAIIASLTVFLKVAKIEVSGTARYTNEEVIKSSGIETGDNLFGVNKFAVREKILSDFPYIERIKITRRLPDTFVFEITDRKPCGYIETEDCRWLIDSKGYLLERMEKEQEISGAAVTSGEELLSPFAGGEITWSQVEKKNCLVTILTAIDARGMLDKITAVDVTAMYSLSFTYDNRLTIKIGTCEEIEKKLKMLEVVLPQLAPTDRGTINLSNTSEARFTPERIVAQ